MDDTVPLTESDVGPHATVIRRFEEEELGQEGYMQYFYHHDDSEYPVRDITDRNKTEPCIERKAENYCAECMQYWLQSFARDPSRRYLFLFTRCQNSDLPQYGEQFIIGAIDKRRALRIDDPKNPDKSWIASQGPMKLVTFKDGFSLSRIDRPELPYFKNLTEKQTEEIVDHLAGAENIYEDCVARVEELEAQVDRKRIWNRAPSLELGDTEPTDRSTC